MKKEVVGLTLSEIILGIHYYFSLSQLIYVDHMNYNKIEKEAR